MSTATPDKLKAACITVLGSGHLRPAPGSWGSLVAVLVFTPFWFLVATYWPHRWALEMVLVVGVLLSSVLAVRWGAWAIERFKTRDPHEFVLDEFAGQWVALLCLPVGLGTQPLAFVYAVGGQFLLFRILDIIKPPPARQLERLPAGWGILFDDLFAGAYANLVGQLAWRLIPLAAWLGVQTPTS